MSATATATADVPTFETARRELYNVLKEWTFGRVIRPCTIPDNAREMDASGNLIVTYYHGMANVLNVLGPGQSVETGRIWFKKSSMDDPIEFGPIVLTAPPENFIPKPGDILMGKISHSQNTSSGKHGSRFLRWYPHAQHLFNLFKFVCYGTEKNEVQLAYDLVNRVADSTDDAWALARLVLFGNVALFSEMHLRADLDKEHDSNSIRTSSRKYTQQKPMRLSVSPLEFVYLSSVRLNDSTIWDEFLKLVPNATPPIINNNSPVLVPIVPEFNINTTIKPVSSRNTTTRQRRQHILHSHSPSYYHRQDQGAVQQYDSLLQLQSTNNDTNNDTDNKKKRKCEMDMNTISEQILNTLKMLSAKHNNHPMSYPDSSGHININDKSELEYDPENPRTHYHHQSASSMIHDFDYGDEDENDD